MQHPIAGLFLDEFNADWATRNTSRISPRVVGTVMNTLVRAPTEVCNGAPVVIIKARRRLGTVFNPRIDARCEAQVLGWFYEMKRLRGGV